MDELNKEKILWVMVGLPGSGKSTLINDMEGDFVILSTDNYIDQKAKEEGLTYTDVFKKYIGQATSNMKNELQKAIKNGNNIVWDQTNLTVSKRKTILNSVPDDYQKIAVEFDIPLNVIFDRLKKRAKETGKVINDSVIYSMYNSKESVQESEGFDKVIRITS